MPSVFIGKKILSSRAALSGHGLIGPTEPTLDEHAAAYFHKIEAAGSSISERNRSAVNELVIGLKMDGLWNSIKSCCLLAGADDLVGAMVPLVGTAPVNHGFAAGDHHLSTGLQGNGSNKYLDSSRANHADPRDNNHVAVWVTEAGSQAICGANLSGRHLYDGYPTTGEMWIANNSLDQATPDDTDQPTTGFIGLSRNDASNYAFRRNETTHTIAKPSSTHSESTMEIFSRGGEPYSGRIAFYSLGESLDLAALDSRIKRYLSSIDDEDALAYITRANVSGEANQRKIIDWVRGLKNLNLYDSFIEGWIYRTSLNAGSGSTIHGLKGVSDGTMSGSALWTQECVTLPALSASSIRYPGITIPADSAGLFFVGEKLINNAFTFTEPVVFAHGGSNTGQRGWQTIGSALMFAANGTRLDLYGFSDTAVPQIAQVTNSGAVQADYNGYINAGPAFGEDSKGGTPTWSTLPTSGACYTQSHNTYAHDIKLRFIGLWNADIATHRVALTNLYHATIGAP